MVKRYKTVRDILGNEVILDTKTKKEYLIDWSTGKPKWKKLSKRRKK